MARSNDDVRRRARSDYVYRRLTAATIAAAYGVSEVTIGRWKKKAKADGDDWDMARSASVIAGEGIETVVSSVLEEFMLQAHALMEEIKNGEGIGVAEKVKHMVSLADAMTKMTASAGRLAPRISELGVAQAVVEELLAFVRTQFPQHLDAIQEMLGPFGDLIAHKFAP
ncbi:MAG: DUF1804 family protein [Pseudodonghicola sp.]